MAYNFTEPYKYENNYLGPCGQSFNSYNDDKNKSVGK